MRLNMKAIGTPEDIFVLQTEEFYVDAGRCCIDFRDYERFDDSPRCGRVQFFLWKLSTFTMSTALRWKSEPERWIQGISLRHPDISFRFHIETVQEDKIFHMRTGDLMGEVIDLKRGDRRSDFITVVDSDASPQAWAFRRKDRNRKSN